MKLVRTTLALTAALGLTACASVDTVTRTAPLQTPVAEPMLAAAPTQHSVQAAQANPYHVTRVDVRVPETLKVSEANTYFPRADIVWREDPLGNRYEQVATIVQSAADQATAELTEGRPVIVDIQVTRFHALTEKTRYTIGGTHDLHYYITVLDATTGAKLEQPRLIEIEFDAFGGARALEAMSRGETQKVRIIRHLTESIQYEMLYRGAPVAPQGLQLSALSSRGI